MKDRFKEYLALTEEEKKAVWEHATIVFDTNILFNLYRYTAETRDDLLAVMESHRDRLWLPYQVGYEYFNKRLEIIDMMTRAHDALKVKLQDLKKQLTDTFNKDYAHHPLLKRDAFLGAYDDAIDTVMANLDEWMRPMPQYRDNDTILAKLLDLFDGKTGEDYSADRLKEIYRDGDARYKETVPPGFKDYKTKEHEGKRHQCGDLIIWNEMMDYAKAHDTDIIFVTEDQKEDWWDKNEGEITGPRTELLREFRNVTGKSLLMYRQNGFLVDAQADVKESTTEEVEVISEEDKELFTREKLEEIQEEMRKSAEQISQYRLPDYATIFTNPLHGILESQKRIQDSMIPQLTLSSTIADLLEQQKNAPTAIAQAAKLAAGTPFTAIPNWAELLGKKK